MSNETIRPDVVNTSSSQDPDALFMQALGFLQSGIYGPAQSLLDRAITLNEEQGRHVAAAYARMALARLHSDEKRLDAAHAALQSAADALEDAGDVAGQLRVAFEQGELYERQGRVEAAHEAYEYALAQATESGDRATAHMRLGALLKDAGNQQGAARHYRSARAAFIDAGNDVVAARAAYELARLADAVTAEEAASLITEARQTAEEWHDETLLTLIDALDE